MLTRRVVRFSLACLPLAALASLGLVCQPASPPTIATNENEQTIMAEEADDVVTETVNQNSNTSVVVNDTNINVSVNSNVVENLNEEEIATQQATNADGEDAAPAVDVEAQNRDAERVARLNTIRDALEAYKQTNSAYPENLDTLVTSGYLSAIPKDINESDFSYTPIGALPAQYYDLCYTLEVGAGTITSGYHCANPDGIANP